MVEELRYARLRELASEYKKTRNPAIFSIILKRVDKLLAKTIWDIRRQYEVAKEVPQQDMYHTAILGVYAAILSVKNNDTGLTVYARIVNYVKREIDKTYIRRMITENNAFGVIDHSKLINDKIILENIPAEDITEQRMLLQDMRNLCLGGKISLDDIRFIDYIYTHGLKMSAIARKYKTTLYLVNLRHQKILKTLRKYLKIGD